MALKPPDSPPPTQFQRLERSDSSTQETGHMRGTSSCHDWAHERATPAKTRNARNGFRNPHNIKTLAPS
eukprot:790464-Heterocapsa_arctica.AAC.1